jgi:hypothetical protein
MRWDWRCGCSDGKRGSGRRGFVEPFYPAWRATAAQELPRDHGIALAATSETLEPIGGPLVLSHASKRKSGTWGPNYYDVI